MMSLLETQKWREEIEHPYSSPERRQEYVYTAEQDAKHMSVKRIADRDDEHVNVNRSAENGADSISSNLPDSTPVDAESSTSIDSMRSASSNGDATHFGSTPEERKRMEHLARQGGQDSAGNAGYMDAGYMSEDNEDDEPYEDDYAQSYPSEAEISGRGQDERVPGINGVNGTSNEDEQQQRNTNGNLSGDRNGQGQDMTSGSMTTNMNTPVSGSARTPASGGMTGQSSLYRVEGSRSLHSDAGAENRAGVNAASRAAGGQGSMRKTERRIVTDPLIAAGMLQLEEDRVMYGQLGIPDNIYIVGTVNMDETTYPFSKRVLDRANTIEFHTIDLMQLPRKGGATAATEIVPVEQPFLRSDYLQLVDAMDEHEELIIRTTERLVEINRILESIHAHVGYRIRDTICFYLVYNQRFGLMSEDEAFDLQLLQKILPRIQGSQAAVRRALVRLLELCLKDNVRVPSPLEDDEEFWSRWEHGQTAPDAYYPESARKLAYMIRRLDEDGFTSYWVS
jgi:hypothetical protein